MFNKLYYIVLLPIVLASGLSAQNIQLIMSPNPSPYISDWRDRQETATLIISNTSGSDVNVKIKTEIFDGSKALVANTDASKMPVLTVSPGINRYSPEDIIPISAISYKGSMARTTLQTGRIPDDNYQICVAIIDPTTGAKIGTSGTVCRFFNIIAYQAPILVMPRNEEVISELNVKGILFRWTPVSPSPPSITTYRLQIFEIMPGQEPMTALRTNQPIVEKDLRGLLQSQWPIDFAPPEVGKKYVWTITPLDAEDRKLVDGYGFAQPFVFSMMTQYIIQLDSLKVKCTNTPGTYTFSYLITNQNPSIASFQNIAVYGSVPAGATISSFTPSIGTPIPASGGILTVSGTITASPSLSNICIKTKIQKQGDPGKNAEDYVCDSVGTCNCSACDDKNFQLQSPGPLDIKYNNNVLSFNQAVTVTTVPAKTIKSIKAELVYFEMIPENKFCLPCNKDDVTYGHFTNGTNDVEWQGAQQQLNFEITTPQLTPCCSADFRWCIRYKIEFTDCTTCNRLVCYKKKKEGCAETDNKLK